MARYLTTIEMLVRYTLELEADNPHEVRNWISENQDDLFYQSGQTINAVDDERVTIEEIWTANKVEEPELDGDEDDEVYRTIEHGYLRARRYGDWAITQGIHHLASLPYATPDDQVLAVMRALAGGE